MKETHTFLLIAFLGYSLYSAVIGKVTDVAPSPIILAVYMTTGAILGWIWCFTAGVAGRVLSLSILELLAICAVGVIVFVSDYAYTRLFVLKVEPAVIYGFIAWVAVGTMIFLSLFGKAWPTSQQVVGVLICCYGAYVINTGRFGLP